MKKKYSKQRSRKRYARRPSPAVSRIRWVFLGVILTVMVGLIFVVTSQNKKSPSHVAAHRAPSVTHKTKHVVPSPKKSEYDFYTMLPKMQVEPKTQTAVSPSKSQEKRIESYILRIGSFHHFADADRMRAQLLMLGFTPSIQKYIVDNQVGYRVYIGPYNSKQTAIKHQQRLRENSISSELLWHVAPA